MIEKRQEDKKKGDDERNDILSHILLLPQRDSRTTIDDMVDHFITFVVAGKWRLLHVELQCSLLFTQLPEQRASIPKTFVR